MKLKNTLLLLILAGGLFAFIKFYESKQLGTKEAAERAGRIAQFDRDQVDSISIKNSEAKIELRKDDKGVWRLQEPVKDRADAIAISQLFTSAESLKFDARIGDGKEGADKEQLKEFGLANSDIKLKFSGKEKPVELVFGKDAAVEGKVYVKTEDSDVAYVIGKELREQISKKVDDFRDRKISEILPSQVHKVSVKTASGEMELEKKDSHWTLTKPLKARADDSKVGDFVSQALTARVESFVADSTNAGALGLQEPRATVSFFVEGQDQPTVLQLGGASKDNPEKVYAKLSSRDSVVVVPKTLESVSTTKPNDLRDRTLVRLQTDIVDRITLESSPESKIVLARNGESWVRKANGKDEVINVQAARTLLDEFAAQGVTDFVSDVATDLSKYGLDQPILKVTFSSFASENTAETKAGEKPIATVLIGTAAGNDNYAKLEDEPYIVTIPRALVELVQVDPIKWNPVEIFTANTEDITSIESTREGAPTIVLEKDKEKGWQLTKGDGKVNQINAQALATTLATLRATSWVGTQQPEHRLEQPQVIVSFKTSDNATHKVMIGSNTGEDSAFATAEGKTGVFTVSFPPSSVFLMPLIDKPATPAPATPAPSTPVPPAPAATEAPANPAPAPAPAPAPPQ